MKKLMLKYLQEHTADNDRWFCIVLLHRPPRSSQPKMYGKSRGRNHDSRTLSQEGETFSGLRQLGMTSPSSFPLAAWRVINQQSAGRVFAYDASHPCRRMWAGNVVEEGGRALLPASRDKAEREISEQGRVSRRKGWGAIVPLDAPLPSQETCDDAVSSRDVRP